MLLSTKKKSGEVANSLYEIMNDFYYYIYVSDFYHEQQRNLKHTSKATLANSLSVSFSILSGFSLTRKKLFNRGSLRAHKYSEF